MKRKNYTFKKVITFVIALCMVLSNVSPFINSSYADDGEQQASTTEGAPDAEETSAAEEAPAAEVAPDAEEAPVAEVTPDVEGTPSDEVTSDEEKNPDTEVTPNTEENLQKAGEATKSTAKTTGLLGNNDGNTREDWLHYSIDLVWDIADESQKYNQKVVTAATAKLQPTYTLTIQTSSVNYEKGKMEIRLPYYMFTKRTTSKSQDGTPAVYNPPKLAPAMIPVPEYPAEATGDKFFSYYFDEETEELVFINTQYIPAGSNQTIQVKYDVLPEFVVDLDKATFQAKGKATPQDEETGSYVDEEKESPIITYQLDTGLLNMSGNQTCTKNTGFEPLKIEDGYRYYKASYRKTVSGNQPFYKTPTFVLNNGGEILGPVENYNSKTVMTLDEASAYYSEEAFVDAEGSGSNSEGAIFDPAEYFDVYVRYPDTGEEVEDRMRITCDVVAWDDDTHQEPEDMNDLLSSYTDYYYTWVKNPNKPRGIWYKNPINQDRGRVEFLVSRPISETGVKYPHGPALFRIGVENNHVVYLDQGNIGKLVITDTGLKQETIVDGINGIAEPNDSPYLNYEICGVYLPVLVEDAVKFYNEETETIEAYDGDWFDVIIIEGSKDGETWEEVYRTSDKNDERLSYSPRYLTHDYFIDLDTLEAWTGKGYRQSRVSILGIKENIVISDDIVHVYMHGLDTTEDYVLREALDKYTNWADIDIYDDQNQSKYSVKDWGMLTLYPMAETGKADITKNTRSVELDTPNEEVHVEFSVRSTRSYSFVDTVPNPDEEIGKLMYQIKQQVPEAFQNTKDYDDIETLVTYDLLPEGYVFDKFTGNTTFSNSGAYIYFSGDGTMWAQFIQPKITTIDNYKGTNRQMVIFEWDVKDQTQAVLNNECSVHGISLDFKYIATIKVEDLVFYQNGHNLVAEQRGDGKEFFGGQEDDGDPRGKSYQNMSVFTDVKDENGDYAYKDVNGDGVTDKEDTILTYSTVSPNVPLSASTGITKHIKGDSEEWTDLDHTDINKDYYYRVRVANGSTTHITDLIIYDTLEEAANTELHSGEVTWKGSFKSIDVHQMISQGYDPVVYYSTADPDDLDYNIVTGREDNIWIDDTSLWSTTCPSDPSTVTAVAVDVRKMKDGTDAILDQNEGVEFIITMQAPPEYPTLLDPDMVYAINRPAYHSYQYVDYAANGEYFTDIGRRVKIYLEPYGKITVRKTSEGRDTPEDTEFLLEGPYGYSKTFKYSDMTDGEMVIEELRIGEYTITEILPWGNENKWSVAFDGAANAREVSSRENAADLELTWDDLEAEVNITNKCIVKDLSGTKTWQERQDITDAKYTIESDWIGREYPSSRNRADIFIYGDGEYVGRAYLYEYQTSWVYGDVPIKNKDGQDIEYTFEEMVSAPVRFEYIDDGSSYIYDIKTRENTILEDNKDVELVLVRTSYKWPEPDIVEIYDKKTVNTDIFDNETILWSGLPSYNSEDGYSCYYNVYVSMKDVGYLELNDGTDISNIRLMDVESTKVWQVPEGANTPEVTLYLEKTVNGETSEVENSDKVINANATGDDLKVKWTELPEYEDGYPVTYSVKERTSDSYELIRVEGDDINGFTVTNRVLTKVSGIKTWDDADDQDGKRPESITVNLLADGEKIDSLEVTEETEWKYEFTKLDKYTEDGKEIKYTVEEEAVEGYETSIEGDAENGFTITNSHTPKFESEKTSIPVTKIWDDKNNAEKHRPKSIEFTLLQNGEAYKTLVLTDEDTSDENTWKGEFNNLPLKDEDEKEYTYTLEETVIDWYTSEIKGDAKNGFEATNINRPWTPKTPKTSTGEGTFTLQKTLSGAAESEIDKVFKFAVIFTLPDGTSKTVECELSASDDPLEFDHVLEGTEVKIEELDTGDYEVTYIVGKDKKQEFSINKGDNHVVEVNNNKSIPPKEKPPETPKKKKTPAVKTGDESDLLGYVAVLLIAASVLTVLGKRKRNK